MPTFSPVQKILNLLSLKCQHTLLQLFKRQFKCGWARDPDEVSFFVGLGEMAAINFPHAAAELGSLGGCADTLGGEEGYGAGLARLHRVACDEIKRHEPVAHAAALVARGVEDRAAADDPGAGQRLCLGRIGETLSRKNQGQDGV